MSALLKAENLELAYGEVAVCRGLSLEINEGEIVALIGANGAGKSTTLRAIAGQLTAARGRDHVPRPGRHARSRRTSARCSASRWCRRGGACFRSSPRARTSSSAASRTATTAPRSGA